MFVIPCKYAQGTTIDDIKKSYVMNSVSAIRTHHPDEKILVVDSDSDDVSYLKHLEKIPNVIAVDFKNKNYLDGAIWCAFDNFPDEKWYCLLQDTITIKHNLYDFINGEGLFYSLMWWREGLHVGPGDHPARREGLQVKDTNEMAWLDRMFEQHLKYSLAKESGSISFVGCWGPCFVAKREILQTFKNNNLHMCLPVDKFGAQMSERLWGICCAIENIDIIANTIDGDFLSIALPREHFNGKTKYHNKIYGGRQ